MGDGAVLIVGGTGGIGQEIARHYISEGQSVVITGRDRDRTAEAASALGAQWVAFDLAEPETIAAALGDIGPVSRLVLCAIARDNNPIRNYTIPDAIYLTTMKLVGYTATVHALIPKLDDDSSVVLFGGRAKDRPYPGSTTVTTVNGGVSALIRTLATELAPVRFNAIHPGIVGDSPFWQGKPLDAVIGRTPTGRLATMAEIVDATVFLLENRAVNGIDLYVDGGWMLM
ncbi:MAG TPA: SDR family oxidoreductase [Acidimicrobiia bacterium]|nr:SDR family oxidoreductase [Acidimicrobiia bacterium]